MTKSLLPAVRRFAFPALTLLSAACGGSEFSAVPTPDGQSGSGVGGSADAPGADSSLSGATARTRVGADGLNAGGAGGNNASAGSASANNNASAGGAGAGNTNSGNAGAGGHATGSASAGASNGGESEGDAGKSGSAGFVPYSGPSVGSAKPFAALAYSAITAANISKLIGDIGVSAGAVSTITGFDAPTDKKYGADSLAPNSQLTLLAQEDVTALVGNIDPRPCDIDYTNVPGGLTGDITLYPGVTCMNSFANDVLLNGRVTLDARGNSNAFFVIRGNLTLTVANGAEVVLSNGAEACGVFWRIAKQVTIGKTVQFYGSVIAGSAITMSTGSTLVGRALAQTAGVHLDANVITIPSDGLIGSAGVCTHLQ